MNRRIVLVLVIASLALAVVACKKGGGGGEASKYPGTDEGAKQMLAEIRTSTDAKGMTLALKPTSADYKAVFVGDAAAKAEAGYEKLWSDPKVVITVSPANTELLFSKATTEDLKKWTSETEAEFPGGYKKVADKFQPGLTVIRWKYTKPGEKLGMSYDGLIYVNGHWVWFPKPWRVLAEGGE